MDVLEIRKQILERNANGVYVFTGTEITVIQTYIQQIAKFMNKTLKYIDRVSSIYGTVNRSLLTPMSYCYVCIDDTDFMSSEKLWDTILSNLGDNILILWVNKLDKRSKFYKHFTNNIVMFDTIDDNWLSEYTRRLLDTNISDKSCVDLINACGHNYDRIVLETDKIKAYRESHLELSYEQILTQFLASGVIWQEVNNPVFSFVDAVITGRIADAYNLLDDCIDSADSVVGVLTLLYNNFKSMLQVQSCKSKDIANVTGLTDWEVKRIQKNIGAYSVSELVNAIKLLRSVEVGIKQDTISEESALQYCLIKIFK